MTTANYTEIKLQENSNSDLNCIITEDNLDDAAMLLRLVEGLKITLNEIPVSSMPSNNPQLMNLIKKVADVSKYASAVLTPVERSKESQYSFGFYDEARTVLARQAH